MRILVAEDDRATRTRILAFLKEWGHEGIPAENGMEAWGLFQIEQPELLITDWIMPVMDGPELLRKIRKSEGETHRYVYAILLTSRSEKSDVVTGMESGADDFVSKPFYKDELRVRIQAAQRIIELERALAEQNRRLAASNGVLTRANARMKKSLQAAAQIQHSFLPEHPPKSALAEFSWIYEPCDELAGDTLNIVPLDDDHVGIYIIDVNGHGVPAALLSVHLSRYLTRLDGSRSILRRKLDTGGYELTPPTEVAAGLNRNFAFNEKSAQYFTALYGILTLSTREFRYTSAGHPGPLVVSNGHGVLHQARPPAIGFLPDPTFTEETIQCATGDRLYFYTDGIFEISNQIGEEFGSDRLREAAEQTSLKPLAESLQLIREAARDWSDGSPFDDDVSLIGVAIH